MGKYLARININGLIDPYFTAGSGSPNSTIVKSYLALLCQGKSDLDAIEAYRKDAFFARAMRLDAVPSSPALRPSVQHSAREAEYDLERDLPMATRLASGPLFVRADSGAFARKP